MSDRPAGSPSLHRDRPRFAIVVVAVCVAWLFAVNLRSERCALVDDAFISFRFAQNLARGDGLVWNPGGARVEGYSNPSLVLLLAVAELLGKPLTTTAQVIGGASAVLCALIVRRLARRLSGSPFVSWLCAGVYLVTPGTAVHAMAGLETNLFTLSVALFVLAVVRLHEHFTLGRCLLAILSYAALTLGRPEGGVLGGLVAITLLAVVAASRSRHALVPVLALVLTSGVLLFAYNAARLAYFGTLLSPPFWVKGSGGFALANVAYVLRFVLAHASIAFLAAIGLVTHGRRPAGLLIAAACGSLFALYSWVEPLVAFESRYVFPVLPLLLALAAYPLSRLLAPLKPGLAPWVGAMALILLVPSNITPPGTSFIEFSRLTFRSQPQRCEVTWTGRDQQIGLALGRLKRPELRIAAEDAGAIGYYSRARVLDLIGLVDLDLARARTRSQFTDLVFGFRPDVILLRGRHARHAAPELDTFGEVGGHGALGRFGKRVLLDDRRMTEYAYVGLGPSDPENLYEWHFWARIGGALEAGELRRVVVSYPRIDLH